MNRTRFYAELRKNSKINLTRQNVSGTEKLLDYIEAERVEVNIAAYALATAWWETGASMTPVEEGYYLGSKAKAFQRKLRYYPWFGRGLVQTTWKDNYIKVARLLGLPDDFFLKNPEKLLEWKYAIPALFKACAAGIYTGKSFQDYIDDEDESDAEDFAEYKAARRVVNGTDQATTIANLALSFEHGLRAAGYDPYALPPVPKPSPARPEPSTPPSPWERFVLWVKNLWKGLLND